MKRKVIQIADKTLVVSLPSDWVRQWGVKKGEEIDVQSNGPRLIVSTSEPRDLKKGILDVSKASERSLRWLLSSLHKKGYDEIEIRSENPEHAIVIDEILRDLFLGFAVVHRSGATCVIRSLSKDLDDQLEVIVRRAFLVTLQLADGCFEAVKSRNWSELQRVALLEKTNNQLTNFCERILNKRGLSEPVKTNFLYVVIWNLEKIADEYKYLCEHLVARKNIGKAALALLTETNYLLRKYYELFYKFDVAGLTSLADEFRKLRVKIESSIDADALVFYHLHHIVLKCADFSSSTYALND